MSNPPVEWDDASLLNPHTAPLELGRQEGRAAGLKEGYDDGVSMGKRQAIELGLELGFILGFCTTALKLDSSSGNSNEMKNDINPSSTREATENVTCSKIYNRGEEKRMKIRKNLVSLIENIEQFPTADDMFHRNTVGSEEGANNCDGINNQPREKNNEEADVQENLQRIRAKFKLLTVHLQMPNYTFKKILEKGGSVNTTTPPSSLANTSSAFASPPGSRDAEDSAAPQGSDVSELGSNLEW